MTATADKAVTLNRIKDKWRTRIGADGSIYSLIAQQSSSNVGKGVQRFNK